LKGDLALARLLLDAGTDKEKASNAVLGLGATALYAASQNGTVVRLLLEGSR